jgi:hypothetical protein
VTCVFLNVSPSACNKWCFLIWYGRSWVYKDTLLPVLSCTSATPTMWTIPLYPNSPDFGCWYQDIGICLQTLPSNCS